MGIKLRDGWQFFLLWTWWLFWDWALPAPEAPPHDGTALEDMTTGMKADQIRWAIRNPKKKKRHNDRRYRFWRRNAGR
jgi:hypothetical protein